MLLKWITCKVKEEEKVAFSNAQEAWVQTKNAEGFLGQVGGWDSKNPLEAGIISFWQDRYSYNNFMKNYHDDIFESNKQANTYTRIGIQIFEKRSGIGTTDITKQLENGKILRVADCIVETGQNTYFEEMQQKVWNAGMTESTGMLSGVFSNHVEDGNRYLVASLWKEKYHHLDYVEKKVPALIDRSSVKEVTKMMFGSVIELDHKWTIV